MFKQLKPDMQEINHTQSDKSALIKLLKHHGLIITTDDIPELLRLGADTYLTRRGIDLPVKHLDEIYLLISELRNETNQRNPLPTDETT